MITTDWEAIADRSPDELLSSQSLPEVSKLSFEDTKVQAPKRRGRGTFSYKKNELYSDRQDDKIVVEDVEDVEDEDVRCNSESNTEPRHCNSPYPRVTSIFLVLSYYSLYISNYLLFGGTGSLYKMQLRFEGVQCN